MKKLLFILIILPFIGNSQTQTTTSVYSLKSKQWIDAPLFKINGTSIDTSTSTIRWFTKHNMNLLNYAYSHGSQWTTSSSDIYFNSGNVYIGKTSGTYKLDVNGSIGGSNFETNLTSRSLRAGAGAGNSENESTQRYNVYLGYASGYTNSVGDQNVYIGSYSGYSGGGKTQSVLIGYQSGYNLTGNNNTFIGSNSGYAATNSDNSIFIGYYAGSHLNKSNSFIVNSIGRETATEDTTLSILYGVQNSTPTNQRLRVNAKMGINISPSHMLDVNGTTNATAFYLNGASLTPKLYYQKSIDTLDNLPYSNSYIKLVCQDTTNGKLYRTRSTRFQTALTNPVTGTGTSGQVPLLNGSSTISGASNIYSDGTYVGIGTAPATYALSVNGTVSANTIRGTSGISGASIFSPSSSSTSISIFPQDKDAPFIRFGAGNDNTTFTTEWARFVSGGSFGIGTTSPVASAKVEIVSTTQGLLPPRMTTTQREAISTPAEGLLVYDLTLHKLYCYDGSAWQACW